MEAVKPSKHTMNEFLLLRLMGWTLEEIAVQWKIQLTTLRRKLIKWELSGAEAEHAAIEAYRQALPSLSDPEQNEQPITSETKPYYMWVKVPVVDKKIPFRDQLNKALQTIELLHKDVIMHRNPEHVLGSTLQTLFELGSLLYIDMKDVGKLHKLIHKHNVRHTLSLAEQTVTNGWEHIQNYRSEQ